jgi:hypothetical protein
VATKTKRPAVKAAAARDASEAAQLDNTGLLPGEKELLACRHRQLSALWDRRCGMGGNEAKAIRDLLDRISVRLSPPDPAELDAKAAEIIASFSSLPWAMNAVATADAETEAA